MTWFKMCDSWADHPKFLEAGLHATSLWVKAGSQCAKKDTDGLVNPVLLTTMYLPLAQIPPSKHKAAVAALVKVRLWHDADTIGDCTRCSQMVDSLPDNPGVDQGRLRAGWYYFHDWQDYQLEKAGKNDPLHAKAVKRRKDLGRRAEPMRIKAAVRERDRDLCRYCGVRVRFGGKGTKAAEAGEIDHVDPYDFTSGPAKDGNSMTNCVVACHACNNAKGQRTPEQWVAEDPERGRPLLPAPGKRPRSGPDQAHIDPESGHGPDAPSRDARRGPGTDPGRVRVGSDQAGSGLAPAGPDRVPSLIGARSRPVGLGLVPSSSNGGHP